MKRESKKSPRRGSRKLISKAEIEFLLFAPYNNAATLLGSFSNWQEMPMQKGKDGYFRLRVPLADGEYQYRFRVQSKSWFFQPDEWVTITDPYATDIDDGTQNGIIRIKDGKPIVDEYVWQHDDKPLPPDHQLVIYEMHVGDFSGGEADSFIRGKYTDVIDKLDYLAQLGINAIELMPVKEFPGDQSWGYNPRYFFATESSYGSTADLKRLIDECHARGIRVFIDGVYNHSDSSAPLAHLDHDYWYHHDPKNPEFNWGPEFNYEKYDEEHDVMPAWQFIGSTVRFWVQEYHLDGIRYDAAKQIGNFDFMRWVAAEARRMASNKPFYNVAEYLPPEPAITGLEGPMDGCWHDFFKHTITHYLCTGECNLEAIKDVIDARRKGFQGLTNVVNYLSNHDHERLLHVLGERGILGAEAFRRERLGAAILITAFGIPMLWMGQEFGEFKAKTIEQNKINWSLLTVNENRELFDTYKKLIALRKQHAAFSSENLSFFHEDHERNVLCYTRWAETGEKVAVVLNLSGEFLSGYTIANFPEDGEWREATKDFAVHATGNQLTLDLPEREAMIFVK
jgi:1,4-alpha-glucan branching enzyme